jgi:hypothetical protein
MKGDNGTNNFNTTRGVRCGKEKKSIPRERWRERQLIDNFERLCVVNGRSDEHDGEETIAVGEEHSCKKRMWWRQLGETSLVGKVVLCVM